MNRKEWREVGKQSFYFGLAMAGIVLLVGLVNLLQAKPFEGEKVVIILGLCLLQFSMFLGLSPFALDSKQKGMEYLLTLPVSRRRLLLIKLLPRLTAVVLFYLAFTLMYGLMGSDAFGGGFTAFSLVYFALFFISFSLSVVHENFIVQSIWAGIALCGYMALGLYICALGLAWKFGMPSSWLGPRPWLDLANDLPSLLTAIAVFLLLAASFIGSLFIAFKKFDLKPARAFNRRQLLFFVPLLLLAFAASLGVTYFVQTSSTNGYEGNFILENGRVLEFGWLGKLAICDEDQQRWINTRRRFLWDWNAFEIPGELFLVALDLQDGSTVVIRLNLDDLAWNIAHRFPHNDLVGNGYFAFRQYGQNLVFLQRQREEGEKPGMRSAVPLQGDRLDLFLIDMNSEKSRKLSYQFPPLSKRYPPEIFAHDEVDGRQFWLVGWQGASILRLWEDGRVEDLGYSQSLPVYYGHLLFSRSAASLAIRRLSANGSETIKEIDGNFKCSSFYKTLDTGNAREIFIVRNERIVCLDLETLIMNDVGPERGQIFFVPPGDFYYAEHDAWQSAQGKPDRWRKIYRLRDGKMRFLKQLDFHGPDFGHIWMDKSGVTQRENGKSRFFSFPDLRELRLKGLD